jgi:hypothetical protein
MQSTADRLHAANHLIEDAADRLHTAVFGIGGHKRANQTGRCHTAEETVLLDDSRRSPIARGSYSGREARGASPNDHYVKVSDDGHLLHKGNSSHGCLLPDLSLLL